MQYVFLLDCCLLMCIFFYRFVHSQNNSINYSGSSIKDEDFNKKVKDDSNQSNISNLTNHETIQSNKQNLNMDEVKKLNESKNLVPNSKDNQSNNSDIVSDNDSGKENSTKKEEKNFENMQNTNIGYTEFITLLLILIDIGICIIVWKKLSKNKSSHSSIEIIVGINRIQR